MKNTTILSNLLEFIPRHKFNRFVKKHDGDKYSKNFTMHNHFSALLYGVISESKSLRSIESEYNSNHDSFFIHKSRSVSKSTISDINSRDKSVSIYEDVFKYVVQQALDNNKITRNEHIETGKITNMIDASEIRLNHNCESFYPSKHGKDKSHFKIHIVTHYIKDLPKEVYFSKHNVNDVTIAKELINISHNQIYVFDRGYYDFGWWKKIDDAQSIFVTRLKKNSPCNNIKIHSDCFTNENIISDITFNLNKRLSKTRKNPYSKRLREVKVNDDHGNILRIVTNDLNSSAEVIADLYKARWSIELFFKWIKQNLRIKKFYSHSENGIKVQILIAMIAYILLKILKESVNIKQNFIHFVNICKAHLMQKVKNMIIFFIKPPDIYQCYNRLHQMKIKNTNNKEKKQFELCFPGH